MLCFVEYEARQNIEANVEAYLFELCGSHFGQKIAQCALGYDIAVVIRHIDKILPIEK
jgi:hypothetical protein